MRMLFKVFLYFFTGSSSDQESIQSLQNLGDRVTIATGDDLCLSVDQFFYTIGLRDEARCDSTCKCHMNSTKCTCLDIITLMAEVLLQTTLK